MQTLKEKAVIQILTLLPVDHPLVRRRTSRYSQRMQATHKSVKSFARKSAHSPVSSLQRDGRTDAAAHIPRRA